VNMNVLKMLAASLVLVACGCSRLPDLNRIQGNMDAMVHYMGVMASGMPVMVNSTARMADSAARMERKSDGLLANLGKKGGDVERAVQNYSQAFLDNDRATVKNLQGIKLELGELKQSLRQPATAAESQEQARVNAAVQGRLNNLEAKLTAIAAKIEKINGGPASKQ
jgi:chemotaxis response regulator CheB